uniref:Uncharacterized protein n=1 Tax=Arundo donax TaxID=35708 RepID=A0A0A9CDP8_ARUDO
MQHKGCIKAVHVKISWP